MKLDKTTIRRLARRPVFWLAGIIVLLLLLPVFRWLLATDSDQKAGAQPTFVVAQGPLTISVTEAGTIRPREQIIIKNEVEGQTVILFLVDEGREVKKGELLIELDASQLEDQRVNQQIQVINAESTFINARENLEVVKNQAQSDVDQAKLDLEFARQDLDQYQQGEFPKQRKEAQAKITLAEETLTNARNTYEWSKKLYEEKYLSETELKRDELSWQKARLDLELAKDALNLLENFTYTRRLAELESDQKKTEMALERVQRKALADVAQAEARLKAGQAEYQQQQDKLAKIDVQIGKTKIYAPMNGTVIYATSTKMSWRSSEEPLDEGQAVRERQELIYLPTTESYNAEIKVHESSLEKIRTGLPVRITIDALPDRTFTGKIVSIAPLPDATSMFLNPDLKVYNTIIAIEGNGATLRNGMSCRAEIIVDRFTQAVYVPVQAVIRLDGQPTVFVGRGRDFAPRPVQLGLDNNLMVQITKGLTAGEKVLLAPPLAAGQSAAPAGAEQQPAEKAAVQQEAPGPAQGDRQRPGLEQMTPEQRAARQRQKRENGAPKGRPSQEAD